MGTLFLYKIYKRMMGREFKGVELNTHYEYKDGIVYDRFFFDPVTLVPYVRPFGKSRRRMLATKDMNAYSQEIAMAIAMELCGSGNLYRVSELSNRIYSLARG